MNSGYISRGHKLVKLARQQEMQEKLRLGLQRPEDNEVGGCCSNEYICVESNEEILTTNSTILTNQEDASVLIVNDAPEAHSLKISHEADKNFMTNYSFGENYCNAGEFDGNIEFAQVNHTYYTRIINSEINQTENILQELSNIQETPVLEVSHSQAIVEIENSTAMSYSDDSIDDPDFAPPNLSRNDSSTDVEQETEEQEEQKENQSEEPVKDHSRKGRAKGIRKRLFRSSDRVDRDKAAHKMRSPCICKSNCIRKIPEDRRKFIWEQYYKMDYNGRRAWTHSKISQNEKKRKITKASESKRKRTLTYTLPDGEGKPQTVCKFFFLKTLGFHEKNDKLITTILKNDSVGSITPKADSRGHHPPPNKCNREILKEHIMQYNPCVSHYRRQHAPNRLYLPSDVKIKDMLQDYNAKHPDKKVTYDTYRKVVTEEMKISFTKLGHEECDTCTIQGRHLKIHLEDDRNIEINSENDENRIEDLEITGNGPMEINNDQQLLATTSNQEVNEERDGIFSTMSKKSEESKKFEGSCDTCKKFMNHASRARISREEYRKDILLSSSSADTSFRSVDLQKVVMLPRIPGSKKTCFTRRIVAFHQTLAIMMDSKHKNKKQHISVLWHEALAGRKAEEITSCYYKALVEERDVKHFVYWVDNCSGQNKNWCLFTALAILVNSNKIAAQDITLKYFEAGHTFMSADSVHHGVEQSMKYMVNLYDFDDFVTSVRNSNSKRMKVVVLENEDVLAWVAGDAKSKAKNLPQRPLLCNMSIIQFRRNSRIMYYKNNINDENFKEFDFLKKKIKFDIPKPLRMEPRGIPASKKNGILRELCPLMPENRKVFWENLLESDVTDLIGDF